MVLPWSTQWLAKVCRVHQYQTFSGFLPLAGGLPKQVVGLEELEGDKWIVHFGPHALAVVDAASGKLNPLPSP